MNRKSCIKLFTPAEKLIYDAIIEVEKMGAHVDLTNVVIELLSAKSRLGDYINSTMTFGQLYSYHRYHFEADLIYFLPREVVEWIKKDEIWINTIPVKLLVNELAALCISTKDAISALKRTFPLLKPSNRPWGRLWENEEAYNKYLERIIELTTPSNPKTRVSRNGRPQF